MSKGTSKNGDGADKKKSNQWSIENLVASQDSF